MFLPGLVLVGSMLAFAPPLPDEAALEREARRIETMLIAPCCWTQPVSQHQSQASEDVKQEIRVLLAAGNDRRHVLDAFVAQYGQRILVEPPAHGFGLVLYGGLALTFLLGGAIWVAWVRKASRRPAVVAAATAGGGASDEAIYEARLDDELRDMD